MVLAIEMASPERTTLENETKRWPARDFRSLDYSDLEVLRAEIITGKKINTKYLHTFCDHQLYTAHDYSIHGKIYRCKNRKCQAKITMLPNGVCVRKKGAINHYHEDNCEQEVRNLKTLNAVKKKCRSLKQR